MKAKQKHVLEGQVVAACNVLREVKMEILSDASELYEKAEAACLAARKLLRAVGEYQCWLDDDSFVAANVPPEGIYGDCRPVCIKCFSCNSCFCDEPRWSVCYADVEKERKKRGK
jgi:hypothetical protein